MMPRGCRWWATGSDKGPASVNFRLRKATAEAERSPRGRRGRVAASCRSFTAPKGANRGVQTDAFVCVLNTHTHKKTKHTAVPDNEPAPRRSRHSNSFHSCLWCMCVGGAFFIKYYLLIIARKTMRKFSGRTSDENATIWTSLWRAGRR